VADLAFFAVG